MKSLADVLQDQDVRAVVDPWNRLAEAKRRRTKALIAALPHFVFRFVRGICLVHVAFDAPRFDDVRVFGRRVVGVGGANYSRANLARYCGSGPAVAMMSLPDCFT